MLYRKDTGRTGSEKNLDVRGKKCQETGEKCVMRNFVFFLPNCYEGSRVEEMDEHVACEEMLYRR